MRKGGGKAKGSGFEREVCRHLSLWATRGAETDAFWRSAMSGGRATRLAKKGLRGANAAGDICATSSAGLVLTNVFFIECKFYRNLDLQPFVFNLGGGKLLKFWEQAQQQAQTHQKLPLLICKQNLLKPFVVARCVDVGEGFTAMQRFAVPDPIAMLRQESLVGLYWLDRLFPLPKPTLRRPEP